MGEMLFQAHSGLRYLVLLAAVAAIGVVLWQRYGGFPLSARRTAVLVFTIVLDVQVLLGLSLLLVRPFFGALMGHIVMMLLALVAAHVFAARAKRATEPQRGFVLALTAVLLPLVFIIGGILSIGRPLV